MKLKPKYILPFVIAAVLAGCAPKLTPEERLAAKIASMERAAVVMRPMPAIIDACVSYLETGSYSEAALTAVGMEKAFGFSPSYKISVPADNMFGKADIGVGIGANASINLWPGCWAEIPGGSTIAARIGSSLISKLKASGYTVNLKSGHYHATKGNSVIDATLEVSYRGATWTTLRIYRRP